MSNEYNVKPVAEGDNVQLRGPRKRIPWNRILSLLADGYDVFIECGRRTAYYIKRRLEKRIGLRVEAIPAFYEGVSGYVFRIPTMRNLVERMFQEERGDSSRA